MSVQQLPITSESTLYALYDALNDISPVYGMMAKIIVETGIPFNQLSFFKKSDLSGKKSITYESKMPNHNYKIDFSDETLAAIKDFLAGLKNDDFAFPGTFTGEPVSLASFRKALGSASKKLGLSEDVTYKTLRKTFIYHLVEADGDYSRAKYFMGAASIKHVMAFIGVIPTDKLDVNIDSQIKYNDKHDIYKKFTDYHKNAIKEAEYILKHRNKFDDKECLTAIRFMQRLDAVYTFWSKNKPTR